MNRKIFVMAAALSLASAQALAQSGGAGSGGSGSSGTTSGGSSTSGSAGQGGAAPSGSSREHADEAAAQQKAASTRPTEGGGGKTPHPVANGPADDRQYSNAPAPPTREQGRTNAGTTANAQTSQTQGAAQAQASATANEVSGRVALVNPADHEIAIDSGSATTQVKVAPDAKITVDGKSASFKDIRQGAAVHASLDRSGDDVLAKKVEVTSTAKKK